MRLFLLVVWIVHRIVFSSRGRPHAAARLCFADLPVFGPGGDGGADGGIDAKQNEVVLVGDISLPPLPSSAR
jgi:hypothetical protein